MMNKSMFLVERNVPDVYVNESRDFQLLARLYDLVFQSTRFSIDSMDYISETARCNNNMLSLLGTKIGFFTNTRISDSSLRKILSAFPAILKNKGSMRGIKLVLNLFERVTNTKVAIEQTEDLSVITIRFFNYLINVDLLYELLEYVRPVGVIINVEFKINIQSSSDYILTDELVIGPKRPNDPKVTQPKVTKFESNEHRDSYGDPVYDPEIGFTIISNQPFLNPEDEGETS